MSLLTAQAFTAVALINLLTTPVIQLVQLMPQLLQCVGSFERIQEYCNHEMGRRKPSHYGESRTSRSLVKGAQGQNERHQEYAISLDLSHFSWELSKEPFLKDIVMKVPTGSITVCVGPVGSGKSMLLKSILGETIPTSGRSPACSSPTAYCSQEPWLENDTIRSNIIGVSQHDWTWYKTVKSACGLDTDMRMLERGDNTIVGSKGLNLSGGQKQRIVCGRTK